MHFFLQGKENLTPCLPVALISLHAWLIIHSTKNSIEFEIAKNFLNELGLV